MKKFKGHRNSGQIKEECARQGIAIDWRDYEAGGDNLYLQKGDGPRIVYNVVSGRFYGINPDTKRPFSSDDDKLDGTPWFDALLDFFYYSEGPARLNPMTAVRLDLGGEAIAHG